MSASVAIQSISIVDDDASMREALAAVFRIAGYRVSLFADAESFLATVPVEAPAALLVDVHLPGLSGLGLVQRLDAARYGAPIVMISGDADVAHAVAAVKCGAFDYMVKPFDGRDMVARVGTAIAAFERRAAEAAAPAQIMCAFPGQATLTPREREVLAAIAGGASNKEVGRRLGISPRTVEVHRARVMDKIGARNAADLVRIVLGGRGRNDFDGHDGTPGMVA